MSKTAQTLLRNFIISVTTGFDNGIDIKSHKLLIELLKEDKDLSMELHDVITNLKLDQGRYYFVEDEGYEL
jgi:ribosomal protein L6P/L9E